MRIYPVRKDPSGNLSSGLKFIIVNCSRDTS